MFFGVLAPDLEWLAFTQKVSRGAYCRSASGEMPDLYVFDPECKFPEIHAQRRKNLDTYAERTLSILVDPGVGGITPPAR
jgi:hypothetical protein